MPELLVCLGRIQTINRDTSSIAVEHVPRPGSDKIAFGASTDAAEEREDGHPQGEASEIGEYAFKRVLMDRWRVVNI